MSPSINLAFTSALALGCLTPENQLNVHNVIMSFRAYYHISKPDFVKRHLRRSPRMTWMKACKNKTLTYVRFAREKKFKVQSSLVIPFGEGGGRLENHGFDQMSGQAPCLEPGQGSPSMFVSTQPLRFKH